MSGEDPDDLLDDLLDPASDLGNLDLFELRGYRDGKPVGTVLRVPTRQWSFTEPASPSGSFAPSVPEFLTTDEAAELLRCEKKALLRAIHRGEVPGVVWVGRVLRLRRDALTTPSSTLSTKAAHRRRSRK